MDDWLRLDNDFECEFCSVSDSWELRAVDSAGGAGDWGRLKAHHWAGGADDWGRRR